ncbi:DUF1016 N-terminal domain-containing protein [Legionella maioricensis]|uniref:DUF1016 N-terminal domain-containing protein n=1 Tax=Legionella maioricensis TaxID=2896528 RepID=UPI003D6D8287
MLKIGHWALQPSLRLLAQCKSIEEREFYLRKSINESWTKRELERQLKLALYERLILNPGRVSSTLERSQKCF